MGIYLQDFMKGGKSMIDIEKLLTILFYIGVIFSGNILIYALIYLLGCIMSILERLFSGRKEKR